MKTCYLTRTPSLLQRQRFLDSRLEEDLQAVWDETSKFTEPAGPGGGGGGMVSARTPVQR